MVSCDYRGMFVFKCFKSSPLYKYVDNDKKEEKEVSEYTEFLLKFGEGKGSRSNN